MYKRLKKYETGASIGNIIDQDMMKQFGLNLWNYNNFMNASMNKIKSDIGKFKYTDDSSDNSPDENNPLSHVNGFFSKKTVDNVRD